MNHRKYLKGLLLITFISGFVVSNAYASEVLELTLKNGGSMPISPGVVYAIHGEASDSEIGDAPSKGLVNLCQMGNPSLKLTELQANKNVTWVAQTPGPILPGQSITFSAKVLNPLKESLHFVAMYGKSKELCSTIHISSKVLRSMNHGDEVIQTDNVISAGAATEPVLSSGNNLNLCQNEKSAIDCLRALTLAKVTSPQIHYFAGYLPSVIDFLENKYGADDVLTLLVPHSGAVSYTLKRH